jgi:TolA-binding protein
MKRRSWLSSAFVVFLTFVAVTSVAALEERDRLFLVGERAIADGLSALGARVLERFVADYPADPRVPAATLLLGRAWLGVGLNERALEAFRKAQTMSPPPGRPMEARLWEGEALFRLKRYAEARTAFEDVVQGAAGSPLAPDAAYGLAWIDLESRRPESAVKRFREMLVAAPDHPLAPTATVTLARTLIDLKRYADAVTLLLDFGTKYPTHTLRPDAQYLLGLARIRSGDTQTGVAELREFIDANPKHDLTPSARQLVGATVARVGTRAELQASYQTLISASPPTPEGLYEAAMIAGKLGQTRDQEATWRRLRKEFPDHAMTRRAALDLANAAFKRKEWKDASALARAAASSDEAAVRAEAWLLAGEADLKQKRYADAVKAFGGVQDVDGVDASVRYRALAGLGLAHEELQHWRPALSAYEDVAGKSPDAALRSWAQDRVKAVKARMAKSPNGKAGDAKPGNGKPKGKS